MRRQGFTIIECAAAVLVGGALLAVLQPAFEGTRRGARAQTSADNLRFWGVASASYINDHGGLLPAYSWRPGEQHMLAGWNGLEEGGVFPIPSGSNRRVFALGYQETDILRRGTGRIVGHRKIRAQTILFPQRRRSHLVLADYSGVGVTSPRAVDPGDRALVAWQRDPLGFEESDDCPYVVGNGSPGNCSSNDPIVQRWPYSSSYRTVPASYSRDMAIEGLGTTIGPANSGSNLFTAGSFDFGRRAATDVAFAAQKVFMFEWHDRHSSDQGLWYAYPQARPNKLMFDGAVNDRPTGASNPGADPNDPDDPEGHTYAYNRLNVEPPPVGDPNQRYPVWYRWTRGGLAGIDYTP